MKGILLLNGAPYGQSIDAEGAYVVCCDGAYEWAHGRVRIDENIGDFDSLSYMPDPVPSHIYPGEKDFTDGEIGLRRLIALGADSVEIYGGFGGRSDHFLGNLHLLYYAADRGVKAAMLSENEIAFVGEGKVELGKFIKKTFSVLPFGGRLNIMYSEGLKYPEPQTLCYGECRGVSNVVTDGGAHVVFAEGCRALIIVNRGDV